jgi:hypothetical protein
MKSETAKTDVAHYRTTGQRVFNDDLLMNPGDARHAKDQFAEIYHLLDHEELRHVFTGFESQANKARFWVRILGLVAVLCTTVALLSAATESLWRDYPFGDVLAIVFEFCGLGAALVAGGSLWLGPWRQNWLEARFMTERIRQWHFQSLIRRGSEIEASLASTPTAIHEFRAQRKKWFDAFIHEHEGHVNSKMDSLASDPDFANDWLHRPATPFEKNSRAARLIFEAYRQLRFDHQYDYGTHKLSEARDLAFWQFLKWPLLRQESAFSSATSFCFVGALLLSISIIGNRFFHFQPALDPYIGSGALIVAILGIAFRTVQDGLGVSADIERYRDYRGKIRRFILSFDETTDEHRRLRLMEEMELAVVDELRGFLRTHRAASFIL